MCLSLMVARVVMLTLEARILVEVHHQQKADLTVNLPGAFGAVHSNGVLRERKLQN